MRATGSAEGTIVATAAVAKGPYVKKEDKGKLTMDWKKWSAKDLAAELKKELNKTSGENSSPHGSC